MTLQEKKKETLPGQINLQIIFILLLIFEKYQWISEESQYTQTMSSKLEMKTLVMGAQCKWNETSLAFSVREMWSLPICSGQIQVLWSLKLTKYEVKVLFEII